MPRRLLFALLIPAFAAPLPATARQHVTRKPAPAYGGEPVILTEQPGTELDRQAREMNASDIADSMAHHDKPVVLVASAPLSRPRDDMALFVELQSGWLCGSAGCSTDVYLRHNGKWKAVLDSVSGRIAILPTSHRGMKDLLISGNDKWVWNGSVYEDTQPTAPIGNLKQSIEAHQKAEQQSH